MEDMISVNLIRFVKNATVLLVVNMLTIIIYKKIGYRQNRVWMTKYHLKIVSSS